MKTIFCISILLINNVIQPVRTSNFFSNRGLYDLNDKIVLLDADNLEKHITSKPYAWLIEFYNFNCGQCKRFAPTFKKFAKDVAYWNTVVKVGAFDCKNAKNIDICRTYKITRYPQLRYFPANFKLVPGIKFGEKMNYNRGDGSNKNANELTEMLSKILIQDRKNNKELNWPELKQIEFTSVSDLAPYSKKASMKLFILTNRENHNSCAQVVLDFSSIPSIEVICAVGNNQAQSLSLYVFHKNQSAEKLAENYDRYGITNKLINYLHKKDIHRSEIEVDLSPGLYNPSDKIVYMDADNFKQMLLSKSHAWFIEFYNFYCGGCKLYSSTYKEFAKDIKNWDNVVRVGAIDCSDKKNFNICMEFNIIKYPTLKYFSANYSMESSNKLGEEVDIVTSKELTDIVSSKLIKDQNKYKFSTWPSLNGHEYGKISNLKYSSKQIEYKFLILANNKNHNGCVQVILDVSKLSNVEVVCSNSSSNSSSPHQSLSLYLIHKNNTEETLAVNKDRREITKNIFKYIDSQIQNSLSGENNVDGNYIYLNDLEASLSYLIHHEITHLDKYSVNDRLALVRFVRTLLNYFNFTDRGREYYTCINDFLISNERIRGRELQHFINHLDQQYKPVYQSSATWYACKGSKPQYRGFTCGLWQLFHTLTINADRLDNDADKVLIAIHNFIKQFLTCEKCRRHFLAMSNLYKLKNMSNSKKAVLWLWIAHNCFHQKLAKDKTEDPKQPKIQFPPERLCSDCRNSTGQWNLDACYSFLHRYYGPYNLKVYTNDGRGI